MVQQPAVHPYLAWREMDNYIAHFLYEHPGLDPDVKHRINHFRYQYLTKVSNICPMDALAFEQKISPWASLHRGDYHRFYHRSPLLQAIENALAPLREDCDLFLLSDQSNFRAFLASCHHRAVAELFREAKAVSLEGVDVLLIPKGSGKKELMHEFIVEKGFTPTLQKAAGIAAVLSLDQPNASYAFPKQNAPESSFVAFLENPIFLRFKELGKRVFLASLLVDLFEGFLKIEFSGCFGIDKEFQKRGIHSLLRDSYGRILHFFDKALQIDLSQYVNLPKFESLLDLVHEEILLWLIIGEPYSQPMLEELIQKTISPPAFFKTASTGMAAFSEVLKVVLESNPTILLFDGCYFENRASLLKCYPPDRFYVVRSPDYTASLQENLNRLEQHKQTIDLLFVNFHENILEGRLECFENKIGDWLAQIFRRGCASSSLTVVIDHTIGFLDAPEIKELLARFQREIHSGILHLVILRSHQKFDLFGFDKASAGSFCVYSRDRKLLRRFQSSNQDEMDVVSRQMLAHYFFSAPQKLEERRRKIFSNALYVYERIADELKYRKGESKQMACVVLKEDRQNFSIDVQCQEAVEELISKSFANKGVPLAVRSGFGFNLTTVASTRFKLLRFSIGMEETCFLDHFARTFNEVFIDVNCST